jgi:small subunit ribosomal protein S8
MSMTDNIGDMLTRIRNGGKARFDKVDIPASRMKISLARIFKDEGFI